MKFLIPLTVPAGKLRRTEAFTMKLERVTKENDYLVFCFFSWDGLCRLGHVIKASFWLSMKMLGNIKPHVSQFKTDLLHFTRRAFRIFH